MRNLVFTALIGSAAWLSGCASDAPPIAAAPAQPSVRFIDVPKFDRELAASLNTLPQPVEVLFYEKVSPNDLPLRLQKWLAVVERDGGRMKVEPPPDEPAPKNPLALLGLLGSLMSSVTALGQISDEYMLASAKNRDAVITLVRNAKGEIVVARITLNKRNK
jgi:hypothetical protein